MPKERWSHALIIPDGLDAGQRRAQRDAQERQRLLTIPATADVGDAVAATVAAARTSARYDALAEVLGLLANLGDEWSRDRRRSLTEVMALKTVSDLVRAL